MEEKTMTNLNSKTKKQQIHYQEERKKSQLETLLALSKEYLDQDEIDAAQACLDEALIIDPKNREARRLLGVIATKPHSSQISDTQFAHLEEPVSKSITDLTVASLSDRLLGFLVDLLMIQQLYAVGVLVYYLLWIIQTLTVPNAGEEALFIEIGIGVFVGWVLNLWYVFVFPVRRKGRSLGKHVMKTRIYLIEDLEDGKVRQMEKKDFFNNLLRTVLLAIDSFFNFLVALLVMINSPYNQRLGDIVAQTIVIKEKPT
ncbi:MAG: hypothetical protein GF308_21510 [Candidatus Heimdallarchaeota archaeon]|nr:hypothetical protein [Candidatus Heimdallarchaeota archaeon]